MVVDLRRRLERLQLFQQSLPQGHLCLINRNTEDLFSSYSDRENDLFEWIGFKGSSGQLCIERQRVRFYVDGRYLQTANKQYEGTAVEVVEPSGREAFLDDLRTWGLENEHYAVIELDGRKWPAQIIEKWKTALGGKVKWKDRRWLDEEAKPLHRSDLDLLEFDEKPSSRLKRIQSNMDEGELHVLLCSDDVAWLFQARSNDYDYRRSVSGVILLGKQYAALFRDMKQEEVMRLSKERKGWRVIGNRGLWKEAVDAVLKKNKEVKVVLPFHQRPGAMSWSDFRRLREDDQSYPLVLNDRTLVERGRLNKNPAEIKSLSDKTSNLAMIMRESIEHCQRSLDRGERLSEIDLCCWIETRAKEAHQAIRLSFPLIVSSGNHTSLPHHHPTAKVIEKGDLVMLDLGFYFGDGGYATDATRCFLAGADSEATTRMKDVFSLVLRGFLRQWGASFFEGEMKARELDALARDLLNREAPEGYAFIHGTGHGLGISDHELGLTIGPSSGITLRENYVYSLEPGLYQERPTVDQKDNFGVRFEDVVVVEKRGESLRHRSLCPMDFDTRLLDLSQLDHSDLAYLEDYRSELL